MPYVSTFMYCESVEMQLSPQGQRMQVSNPLHIFTPMFVPGTFSFAVVYGILDINSEIDNAIRFTFSGPDEGQEPILDTGVINIPRNTDMDMVTLPPEMRGLMLNMDFRNVVFRKEGNYKSTVFLNGDKLGEYPIWVKGKETI